MRQVILFLALAACSLASDIVYNNELFPRDSLYGKLQANMMLESEIMAAEREIDQRQFNPNGNGLFNRNPWVAFTNRLPVIRNPEFTGLLARYDSCTAPDGESGVCLGAGACSLIGGRASGACVVGSVCCINVVSKCSGVISMNNTYWQAPAGGVAPSSTCSVSVRLDQNLPEQKQYPVCQIRLDFVSFSISQPSQDDATAGKCSTDNFQVSGGSSKAPAICGDNEGQHMYISVPSSGAQTSDVQLLFSFGSASASRTWNIKIAMIPCGASYAAPTDCLQYFTGGSGVIKSFNWKDTVLAVRQLASLDYNVCIRSDLVNGQRANGVCYQLCTVTNTGAAFSLSGDGGDATLKAVDPTTCTKDFVVISGGVDAKGTDNDRYCGTVFSGKKDDTPSVQVCSAVRSFKLYVKTDQDDNGDKKNMGFCFNYMQRVQ